MGYSRKVFGVMSLILQALNRFGVDRFKYAQVVFQRGQFFRGREGKVAVFYDEAGKISEKRSVFYKVASASPSPDPPAVADTINFVAKEFHLSRAVQKILAQGLWRCQLLLHALKILRFSF